MSEELRKKICRAFFSGHTVAEIAKAENIPPEETAKAITWGVQSGYLDKLEKRGGES
ncbi:MAG: hypothetical protein IJJ69_12770 [Oscillospiraceae bacterium]|nr:hypothetical protein [Oscillospiraceae bacterium]